MEFVFFYSHRANNSLNVPLQSAYRQHHSTETALLKVHNDVLQALDRKECVFLVLLDLSAAFDTVNHSRLKARLKQKFWASDSALRWLKWWLSERQQAVTIKGIGSEKRTLEYGVPQGSVLGPELFKDYVAPLSSLIQSFGVNFHGYADDTQIYVTPYWLCWYHNLVFTSSWNVRSSQRILIVQWERNMINVVNLMSIWTIGCFLIVQ